MLIRILSVLAALLAVAVTGCTRQEVVVANAAPTQKAAQPLEAGQRLNVGIVVFDPGIEEGSRKSPSSPGMRRAEARYMAYLLRQTLSQTGHWGEVNVVPEAVASMDLTVNGRILVSNGLYLSLEVLVTDATGQVWLKDTFQGGATKYSYDDRRLGTTDHQLCRNPP